MISLDQMPEDRDDLAKIHIEFPHLPADETAKHRLLVGRIVDYLEREGIELDAEDLAFLRSAQVADKKFWIWSFRDDANLPAYATASEDKSGRITAAFSSCDGLTPEQAMLADYHNCY